MPACPSPAEGSPRLLANLALILPTAPSLKTLVVSAERQARMRRGLPHGAPLFSQDFSQKGQRQSSTPSDPHKPLAGARENMRTLDNLLGSWQTLLHFKVAGMGCNMPSNWVVRGRLKGIHVAEVKVSRGCNWTDKDQDCSYNSLPAQLPAPCIPSPELRLLNPHKGRPCPVPGLSRSPGELALRGSSCWNPIGLVIPFWSMGLLQVPNFCLMYG